jgi:RHS repeat-associated protein
MLTHEMSNLASKAGVNYTYDTNHPHAVASLSNGNSYTYDANGNMTQRVVNGQTFNLSYDAENRMVGVSKTGLSATFVYDADGKRVQSTINNVTTKFIGSHYEIEGTTVRKYYFAGSTRIAMRTGTDAPVYFLQDHLGSTSITTDSSGDWEAEMMYKAWGEVRYESTNPPNPTKYTYTGQYSNTNDFGLMYYGARWYDPSLSRFAQADSIVPGVGNPKAYDRYAYGYNNPSRYIDPSGHIACIDGEQCGNKISAETVLIRFGVILVGDFTTQQKIAIMTGVVDVGLRIGSEVGDTAINAFKGAYLITANDPLKFVKGTEGASGECASITIGGCTSSSHLINFNGDQWTDTIMFRNNVVHELGHAFADLWPWDDRPKVPNGLNNSDAFANGPGDSKSSTFLYMWNQRMGGNDTSSEYFADLFLGWTYNTYGGGASQTGLDIFTVAMTAWVSNPGQ